MYLFERNPTTTVWEQTDKLTASDGVAGDGFGVTVALDGDTLLVGQIGPARPGAVYVFDRNPITGVWSETDKLTASDGAPGMAFGEHIGLSGDLAVISMRDDDFGTDAGAVYVFRREFGVGWIQADKLHPTDAHANHGFGVAVAIDGTRIVVGAANDTDCGMYCGALYVFERRGGPWEWVQTQKIRGLDIVEGSAFGRAIGLAGDVIVTGATGISIGTNPSAGAGYVFELVP
ncbi:MAG: hypothetical protein D6689_13175 [Deltaproteobacteria bacterium]|nr:MAG: hypothetical protein D6689_13175 [Deltaproteobacteria bacterium]